MYEYMKALYLRFFREPDCNELWQEIYETQQEFKDQIGAGGQEDTSSPHGWAVPVAGGNSSGELCRRVPAGLGYGQGVGRAGTLLL